MTILFVYVPGLKGPEPQKWPERPFKATGGKVETLQEHELPDDYGQLPISQLATLYPFKGAPQ